MAGAGDYSGGVFGNRDAAAQQNSALNYATTERTAYLSSPSYTRVYKADDNAPTSSALTQQRAPIAFSAAADATRGAERYAEAEGNYSASAANASRQSTYDFHAVLRKYNIRLDGALPEPLKSRADEPSRVNGSSTVASLQTQAQTQTQTQTPQLSEFASRSSLRAPQQLVSNVVTSSSNSAGDSAYDQPAASKYDFSKSEYFRRTNEPSDSAYAYSAAQTRARATPLGPSYGSETPMTPAYAVPNSLSSSSLANPASRLATQSAVPAQEENATVAFLRRQLADRDAECATLRRQLEDEREKTRRSHVALTAANEAAAAAAAAAAQPDPTAAARLIELETMRERYEELLAEKTSLEDSVVQLRRELQTVQQAPSRRYADSHLAADDEDSFRYLQLQRTRPSVDAHVQAHVYAHQLQLKAQAQAQAQAEAESDSLAYVQQQAEQELALSNLRRERVNSGCLATAYYGNNSDALLGDAWRQEAQTLRERNRVMTEENTALRSQLLASKRPPLPPSASTSASASADADLRYYQAQVMDARETVRKLQEQLACSSHKLESRAASSARVTDSAQDMQSRRFDSFARSPSPSAPNPATVTSNISRLLERSNVRASPVKATLPLPPSSSGNTSAYRQLYDDGNRRNRLSNSETQLNSKFAGNSASAVQSHFYDRRVLPNSALDPRARALAIGANLAVADSPDSNTNYVSRSYLANRVSDLH